MIAEIGHFAVILAVALAFFQASPLFYAPFAAPARRAAGLQFTLLSLSMLSLAFARVTSNFSVVNVAEHSNHTLPMLYKIAGTWGNHEGSLLLWVWVLSLFGAAFARRADGRLSADCARLTLGAQGVIGALFLLFLLIFSNPFARQFPAPGDGAALNPLLQDIGLLLHPPLLYVGYVGFSLVFALAVAGMLRGEIGSNWARSVQPWILVAWSFLTLGIGLGSWWAYRELGWGGYWFWDPVENASLLPWLTGTALLHANLALARRGIYAQWVALLSVLTFSMSMIGTFLVRSGLITSVHSFATDPTRGVVILGIAGALAGGGFLLFALRGERLAEGYGGEALPASPLSREGILLVGTLFFTVAAVTVLLGTVYPLAAELIAGYSLTVGAPYFNRVALPVLGAACVIAAIAPLTGWVHDLPKRVRRELRYPFLAAAAAGFAAFCLLQPKGGMAALGFSLSAWLAVASIRLAVRARASGANTRLPAAALAHFGAALVVAGIAGMSLQAGAERAVSPGETFHALGYAVTLESAGLEERPNHRALTATLSFRDEGGLERARLSPEYRLYGLRGVATSEASVRPYLWGDLYAVVGEPAAEGTLPLRIYANPMVHFLWLGVMLMAAGGMAAIRRNPHLSQGGPV